MSRAVALSLFVSSIALGACAGRGSGPAVCPGTHWCGAAAEVAPLAEETFGETLTCPIHIAASQVQGEGAALPKGVPQGAHGRLDEKRTRKHRDGGDATTCCYQWVDPCPAG